MAGTMTEVEKEKWTKLEVSMESGLDGRNNHAVLHHLRAMDPVSMESGLDGRNNCRADRRRDQRCCVSMESGLDGRNNP